VTEIDFITALGRVLRDRKLRDHFAANPQAVAAQLNLGRNSWPAFVQLVPEDLEFQSRILLRKRLELVRPLLPETIRRLGQSLWPSFLEYSQASWPTETRAALQDAFQFCQSLRQRHPRLVSESELNRLRFALSERHLAVYWCFRETIGSRTRPMIQLFLRFRTNRWRELALAFGF
jgi:hypothetical protein